MYDKKEHLKGWGLLSKYRTELMGFSIIWVMFYHSYLDGMVFPKKLGIPSILNFILKHGACGVEIFLLLSGLGLYYSFNKNKSLSYFYKNRVKRVVIPYFLIASGFWIWQDLFYKPNIVKFIKNITLFSFWETGYIRLWYIALLIPLYLIFPFLYYFIYGKNENEHPKKKALLRCAILVIANIILNSIIFRLSLSYYGKIEIALCRITIFLLGILIESYAKRDDKVSYGAMIAILVIYSSKIYATELKVSKFFNRFWYISLAFVVCFILIYFFELLHLKERPNFFLSKILTLAGKYSLELYILHIWARKLLRTYRINFHINGINLNKYNLLQFGIVILFTLFFSFLFAQIEKIIFRDKKKENSKT